MNKWESIEEQLDELEFRIESIASRAEDESDRRSLIKEFGTDLVEKARQGAHHLKALKKNYVAFQISKFFHPNNGKERYTKTLDSYEALSTKVKSISDNLNSFINVVYLGDKAIKIQVDKFEDESHPRNISAGHMKQMKKSLPTIDGKDLEEITSQQFEKFKPFFSNHRNTTQHAKTSQNLNKKKNKITIKKETINNNSEEVNIYEGLKTVFEDYVSFANQIVEVISKSNSPNLDNPNIHLEKKVQNKVKWNDFKRKFKQFIFAMGVATPLVLGTAGVMKLYKQNNKANEANKVITSMYEAQDNKKTISITSLINEQNTEDINNQYTKDIKQNLWRVDLELGNVYGNTSRKHLIFFVGKEHQEYVNIIKQIKATEDFAVDSIRRYLIANHQGHAIAGEFLSEIIKYGESMHDSLDDLVRKKLAMDRSTIAFQTEVSDLSNDPIIYSLQQAVMFAKKELRRDFWQLTTDEAYELFLDPKIVVKLNENFDEGMKEICDSLEISRSNKRIYEFLTNNTMYLTLLSKNQTNLDEVEKDIREELSNNIHLVGSSMVKHNGEKPYDVYANIVWSRKFSQRPLRALKMPYIYDKIDTVFTEYHNVESRPEFEVFMKEVKEGTYLHKDLRLN